MFVFHIAKWFVLVVPLVTNTFQVFIYRALKRQWKTMPVVAATITKSRIDSWNDPFGRRHYDADIELTYRFRGEELTSDTPVLRGPELWVTFRYNSSLVDRYKAGEMHNVRVFPSEPPVAYLEIAPFSKISARLEL